MLCGLRSRWKTSQSLRKLIPWMSMSNINVFVTGERVSRWRYMYSDKFGFEMQSQNKVLLVDGSFRGIQYLGTNMAFPFLIFFKMSFQCKTLLLDYEGLLSSFLNITAFLNMFSRLKEESVGGAMSSFSEPEKTYQYYISVKKMLENPPELILVRRSCQELLIFMKFRIQLFQNRFLHFTNVGALILFEIDVSSCQLKKISLRFEIEAFLQYRESCNASVWVRFIKLLRVFYILAFYSVYPFIILDSARLLQETISPVPIFGKIFQILRTLAFECIPQLNAKLELLIAPVRRLSKYYFK